MKKYTKLFLSTAMLLTLGATVISCGGGNKPSTSNGGETTSNEPTTSVMTDAEKLEEAVNTLVYPGLDAVVASFKLYNKLDDVTITYTSDKPDFLSISEANDMAIVTQPAKGSTEEGYVLVMLKAELTIGSLKDEKTFAVKVLEKGDEKTIAEVLKIDQAKKDDPVTVKAKIVALGSGCAYVADSTGGILVYDSSAIKDDMKIGDTVKIDGSISYYQGVPQFSYSSAVAPTLTVIDEDINYTAPAVQDWDATKIAEYMGYTTADKLLNNHVKFTGNLKIDGKYYNITIPGLTKGNGAAICYPTDAMKTELAALDGKNINVVGYTLYISHDYMYVFAESVEEAIVSDDEKFAAAVSNVTVASEVYDSIELASTSSYDATVTWASDNAAITIGEDGHTATVTQGEADVTVKLTATITLGDKSQTKEFTVTVKGNVKYDHAGTEADPFSVADAIKMAKVTGTTATTEKYYIKGIIAAYTPKEADVTKYGNISFDISDDGKADSPLFKAYQVYYLEGNKFTAADQVAVGDTVVLYGQIVTYGTTYETNGKGSAYVYQHLTGDPVAVTGVTADSTLEVTVGKTKAITASVEPSNATNKGLTFTSDAEGVATVDEKGNVKGITVGTANITVASKENAELKAVVAVTVKEAAELPSGEAVEITFNFSGTNGAEMDAVTQDGVTVTFAQGTGNNAPKWYDNGSAVRTYGGNTLTIDGGEGAITKVVLNNVDAQKNPQAITAAMGAFDMATYTWTGAENLVTLAVGEGSGHYRIPSITVTYIAK